MAFPPGDSDEVDPAYPGADPIGDQDWSEPDAAALQIGDGPASASFGGGDAEVSWTVEVETGVEQVETGVEEVETGVEAVEIGVEQVEIAGDEEPASSEGDEVTSELDALEATLAEVEAALRRIDEGVYGTCEVCRQPIGDDVLAEQPVTRHCRDHLPITLT